MAGSDCDDALTQLYEYLDGELTPDRRESIRTHLDDCAPCLAAHDFEDGLLDGRGGAPEAVLSPLFQALADRA